MNLREKVVHSLSWNLLGRIGTQIFQLAFSIALARLLTPTEFGAVGMLIVFTGFAQILSDSGLSAALIYNQELTEAHRSTAFWLQLTVGACLTGLFFFGAPVIASFYGIPILASLTRLISIVFLVQAAGQTQCALLSKDFYFRRLTTANVGATLISGFLAIFLAWRGFGVWALAWQIVAMAAISSVLYWLLSQWRPQFLFDTPCAVQMGRYAVYLLGFGSLNYWLRNGDNLAIGKFFGSHALGVYARAYSLMLLPVGNISSVLGQVMFPALSHLQNDQPRFGRFYLTSTRLIALVSFPMMTGMALLATPFVNVLLGSKWAEVIPILSILSFVGLAQAIIVPAGWVYTALGRTRTQFQIAIVLVIVFIIAMVVGFRFGMLGWIYAYAVFTGLGGALHLHIVGQYMNMSLSTILRSVAKIAVMSLLMGAAIWGIEMACPVRSNAVHLALGTTTGILVYLTLCVSTRDKTFFELMKYAGIKK